eukprot:GEZU01009763.1.p1 GENE.GEZU01009763.1~~GEZU01009763.1.p1  ORF type:complete len:189 (-),score=60.23 GEZU01009763.1:38-604(-)
MSFQRIDTQRMDTQRRLIYRHKMRSAPLTDDQLYQIRAVFDSYDKDNTGTVDINNIVNMFNDLGFRVGDEDIFPLLTEFDDAHKNSKKDEKYSDGFIDPTFLSYIEFDSFLQLFLHHRRNIAENNNENDLIDAFHAAGGNLDRTGQVSIEALRKAIDTFGLNFDIDRFMSDSEGGTIGYTEFAALFTL